MRLTLVIQVFDGKECTTIVGAASCSSARGTIQIWQKRAVRRSTPAARRFSILELFRVLWQSIMIAATLTFIYQNVQVQVPRPQWLEFVLRAMPSRAPTTAVNVARMVEPRDTNGYFFAPPSAPESPGASLTDEEMSRWADWMAYRRFDEERRRLRTKKAHKVIVL
ncbi:hypothetical protein C8Q77DRAFT_1153147 [Trametes polyzona]|nr:hypothetical protein C8Q77DRAFT_1153147 [Trametes polyzona]